MCEKQPATGELVVKVGHSWRCFFPGRNTRLDCKLDLPDPKVKRNKKSYNKLSRSEIGAYRSAGHVAVLVDGSRLFPGSTRQSKKTIRCWTFSLCECF